MNISEKFNGFNTLKDTIFLKDFSKENKNLKKLESIHQNISDLNKKRQAEREISLIKWGLEGENNVYFELKNSLLPMLCMHDIRIEIGDLSAQIDFLILTNKFFCIVETKHLVGDIRINADGDFIRIIKDENGNKKEEGMYNPITQGNRHVRILRKFLEHHGFLNIPDFPIKSIAVLANPKTIINKEFAPEKTKENIYRYDHLVRFLQKEFLNLNYNIMISDDKIDYIGQKILNNHTPIDYNYESKYKVNLNSEKSKIVKSNKESYYSKTNIKPKYKDNVPNIGDNKVKLESELRNLRKKKAKEFNLKAYELFTNKNLELLLEQLPKTLDKLNNIELIPPTGFKLIGEEIIEIINQYFADIKNKTGFRDAKNTDSENPSLRNSLIGYRRKKAIELNIEDYKIFTNAQLELLLTDKPTTLSEFSKIKGFKSYHINSYGSDILNIINEK